MNHTIKATSLISKAKIKKETKTRQRVSHMPEQRQLRNPFSFLPNAHPFLTGTLGVFPCVTERKQRLLCMLSKKDPPFLFFFQTRFLSPLPNFNFSKLPAAKGRKPKLQPLPFFLQKFANLFSLTSFGLFIANVWFLLRSLTWLPRAMACKGLWGQRCRLAKWRASCVGWRGDGLLFASPTRMGKLLADVGQWLSAGAELTDSWQLGGTYVKGGRPEGSRRSQPIHARPIALQVGWKSSWKEGSCSWAGTLHEIHA